MATSRSISATATRAEETTIEKAAARAHGRADGAQVIALAGAGLKPISSP